MVSARPGTLSVRGAWQAGRACCFSCLRRLPLTRLRSSKARSARVVTQAKRDGPVIIGLAADSGCGKSTFMRRMTSLFGGKATPPEGGNPDSNTLISDTTTVLCLDDYHLNDRQGRKDSGLTALNLKEQNFGALRWE